MHGRVKVRSTEEQKEQKRLERLEKVKKYKQIMAEITEKRNAKIYDENILNLAAAVLLSNPDIISLWNLRREVLLYLKEEDKDNEKIFLKDIPLTEQCLRVNPKSYGSWHHRMWILDNIESPCWEDELKLCTKYLQMDERNFHCWDFRRFICQRAGVSALDEYNYTTERITTNFSNYSSWHYRSKLLPLIFPNKDSKLPIDDDKHKEELELVLNAAFTDPNDQSAWFYQRWLLGLGDPLVHIVGGQLMNDSLLISFSKNINLNHDYSVKVYFGDELVDGKWDKKNPQICSKIWFFCPHKYFELPATLKLILTQNNCNLDEITVNLEQNTKWFLIKPTFNQPLSLNLKKVFEEQLEACEELLTLEPESKWTLLTSILLMIYLDRFCNHSKICERLILLSKYDSYRSGYYFDFLSQCQIQHSLLKLFHKNDKQIFYSNDCNLKSINLNNLNLTSLYHTEYLFFFKDVNLSFNKLASNCLAQLQNLVSCELLNLSNNLITSIDKFPVLDSLINLSIVDNLIKTEDLTELEKRPNLKQITIESK